MCVCLLYSIAIAIAVAVAVKLELIKFASSGNISKLISVDLFYAPVVLCAIDAFEWSERLNWLCFISALNWFKTH